MLAAGAAMMADGTRNVSGGVVLLAAGGAGVPVIATGVAEIALGADISVNAAINMAKGYNYGKEGFNSPSKPTTSEPAPSKVEKSKTTETIGNKYKKTTEVRPSKENPGQSRAEIIKYKNPKGKTIKVVKDSYDRGNKFQGRKPKFPLPKSTFTPKPLD